MEPTAVTTISNSNPKTPPPVHRLARGELKTLDIATSTMANIGPAFSFYFSFAGIVAVSGIASPLTVLAAAAAIFLLGNTLSVFAVKMPTTGSFPSFIGRSLGTIPGVASAVILIIGYILGIAGAIAATGAITAMLLKNFLHVEVSWIILSLGFVALAFICVVSGVKASTRVAGLFFLVEMLVLVLVSTLLLITHAGSINLAPFNPANLPGGFLGFGLGFPLAMYLFIGWENSASLAEETSNPRRSIPRAIFASLGLMAVTYVFVAFASIVGFNSSPDAVAKADMPFIDLATTLGGGFSLLAVAAGFTSCISVLIAGTNSQARVLFSAGRERLLPHSLGKVAGRGQTPVVSLTVFLALASGIVLITGWNADPIATFSALATLGTILIIVVYLLGNIGLPVYMVRRHRAELHVVRHIILPLLGAGALVYPLISLLQPGQEQPYSYFPAITLVVILAAIIYASVLRIRDPKVGDRIGSIIADH